MARCLAVQMGTRRKASVPPNLYRVKSPLPPYGTKYNCTHLYPCTFLYFEKKMTSKEMPVDNLKLHLSLPWPPSNNRMHRRVMVRGRPVTLLSEQARKYHQAVGDAVIRQTNRCEIPDLHSGRIAVKLDVYPPDRRRRDLDNIFKAVLDGCTKAGVWADDDQIDELCISRLAVAAGGVVVVTAWAIP